MNPEEIWQVDANGTIYEASFDELKQWVVEGAVLPTDKIRRGNLRWLEAGRVPLLHGVFNAKFVENPLQVQTNITHAAPTENTQINNFANVAPTEQMPVEVPPQNFQTPSNPIETEVKQPQQTQVQPQTQVQQQTNRQTKTVANQNVCSVHVADKAEYICSSCKKLFCKECPETYGVVRVCPECREMCKSLSEVRQKAQKNTQYQKAITEGFGIGDFAKAAVYPFKHPASLIIGCIIVALFSIGLPAMRLGSLAVTGGGIVGVMIANMIIFACISNTIEEFSRGNLTADFMPKFEDFNLLDDIIQPFFYSVGVYAVSFGFLIIVILVGVYFSFNPVSTKPESLIDLATIKSQLSNSSPASKSFDELMQKDAEQKSKIAELKAGIYPKQAAPKQVAPQETAPPQTAPQTLNQPQINADQQPEQIFISSEGEILTAAEFEKMMKNSGATQNMPMMQNGQVIPNMPMMPNMPNMPTAEEPAKTPQQIVDSALQNYTEPINLAAFIALFWAIFYFPAACLVAGYTRNLNAVINPLIGLDTIKRLGFSYIKILLMTILLSGIAGLIFKTIGDLLSPFDLPRMGNIPATMVSAFIGFYFCVVFAAVLGYAFYKCKNLSNC
jgi:hypothetical protein